MPIRVSLKRYDSLHEKDPQLGLLQYICGEIGRHCNSIDKDELHPTLLGILCRGEAIIVLDGLDEILEVSSRRDFVKLVLNFVDEFSMCPVLVTCRIKDYPDAPLPDEFEAFTLHPLNAEEVQEYALKYFKNITRPKIKISDARNFSKDFISKTSGHPASLRDNPLMLSLMCGLYEEYKGRIPQHRYKIYEECSNLIFKRWDEEREDGAIQTYLPEKDELFHLLSYLAEKIYPDPKLIGGVSRAWIKETISDFFCVDGVSKADAKSKARTICDAITGRSWVMVDIGSNTFDFTHRCFLEYFFSRHLVDLHPAVDDLIEFIFPLIEQDRGYSHPAHLAIQSVGGQGRKQLSRARNAFVDGASINGGNKEKLLSRLEFIADSLEYLSFSNEQLFEVCGFIIVGLFDSDANISNEVIFEIMNKLLVCQQDIKDDVKEIILEKTSNGLVLGCEKTRNKIMSLMFEYCPFSGQEEFDVLFRDALHKTDKNSNIENFILAISFQEMRGTSDINSLKEGWATAFVEFRVPFDVIVSEIFERISDGFETNLDHQIVESLITYVLDGSNASIEGYIQGVRCISHKGLLKVLEKCDSDIRFHRLFLIFLIYIEFAEGMFDKLEDRSIVIRAMVSREGAARESVPSFLGDCQNIEIPLTRELTVLFPDWLSGKVSFDCFDFLDVKNEVA